MKQLSCALKTSCMRCVALSAGVLLLISVRCAYAESAAHTPAISDLKYYWVNFLVYLAILYLALRKVVPAAWAARREQISASLQSASAALNTAEQELQAVQDALRGLQEPSSAAAGKVSEVQALRAEIIRDGQAEAQRIIQDAEHRAARIRAQAREQLAGELRTAQASLRAQLVERAVESARSRFARGDFSHRDGQYRDAAVNRAKRLVE